ncbi:beta strand repeat-containing protein [Winogradskyella sp. PG-2]|uniref:beta strand repeat-containing protein n=1 Tax=Winogradskyella sp. PG-2 TaxID=754409 RepID=UPI0004588A28|nr:hypothetical protein [Winogradskyella sp. PG-2]BAO75173.1 hypothetical protein WPG_0943 [Winogradskyella sp. PG-2]
MKIIRLTCLFYIVSFYSFSQVGVGNTDPKASLDVSSSNVATPANTDGILIPRIDNFPATNPIADQDGMMVFVTGNGTPIKGLYYWDNNTISWVSVQGSDADIDFYEIGTTSNPDAITDDIYTLGKLKIGQNSAATSSLSIHDWNSNNSSAFSISRSLNTVSLNGQFSGSYITLDAQTSDNYFGYQSFLSGNIQAESSNFFAQAIGSLNSFTNLFSGRFYSASGNGRLYGTNVSFLSTVTNTGNKYGFNVSIPSSLSGTHYGLYSDVQKSSGYAAYLLGRTSLGNTSANRYLMPSIDGTAGQVMTTDGTGNVTFETLTSGVERINDLIDGKSDNDGSDDGSSIFLGVNSGAADDSSSNQNVGIGYDALSANTTGILNVAIGWGSLRNNTSNSNTAIGYLSASGNTSGSQNTAIGRNALIGNSTGSNNTALGSYAGYLATGSGNLFLGANAGFNEVTISNKLFIENTDADENSALIYGDFGTDNTITGNILRTNSEFQIGNPTITGYAFPTTDGTNGQILTTDGAGNLNFQDITGDGDTQNTLDQAYDEGGAGAGRIITADNGDIEILGDYGLKVETSASIPYGSTFVSNSLNTDATIFVDNTSTNSLNNRAAIKTSNALTEMNVEINRSIGGAPGLDVGVLINNTALIDGKGVSFEFTDLTTSNFIIRSVGYNHDIVYDGGSAASIHGFKSKIEGSGSAYKYGLEIEIPASSLGQHYGIYSDVQNPTGYAGYFAGRVEFGHGFTNRYFMPGSDGTNGQVMTTDGTGNVTFQDATINTDNQQIDNFNFNTTTNILSLEMEDDGQTAQTVDLSTLQDGIGTDDQNLTLLGTNLSIENGNSINLNTINTDDQQIDTIGLSGTVLGISLEDDGVGIATVDLSSINTDDQQIDNFSFNTSTNELTLEVEDDGQAAQTVDLSSLNPTKVMARITMNNDQTETGSGTTKVNFDTRDFDVGNHFNLINDNYVVPTTGKYRVTGQITMSSSTDTGNFAIRIRINNFQQRRSEFNHHGNGAVVRQVTSILSLTAGDTIDVSFVRPSVGATIESDTRDTFFEIEQL